MNLKGLTAISKIISNFFNPIVSLIIFYIFYSRSDWASANDLWSINALFFMIALPTIVWIGINVKKGNYTNMDVSNRKERNSLYVIIVLLCGFYLAYAYFVKQYLDLRMLLLGILLILMQISNFFIKSSMHTALNIYVAFLFLSLDYSWGVSWIMLSIIIGITRIILKRHTLAEVISGAFLGTLIGISYYLIN